jgi:hypothetical protein
MVHCFLQPDCVLMLLKPRLQPKFGDFFSHYKVGHVSHRIYYQNRYFSITALLGSAKRRLFVTQSIFGYEILTLDIQIISFKSKIQIFQLMQLNIFH